jgi:ABC-type antimicrobial peptide transport system permease subunit
MALGADRGDVVRLILRGAVIQSGIGLLLGIPAALLAGHYLRSQLYQMSGFSPSILLAACVVLGLSSLLAGVLPARRASRVEPMQALRTE